MTETQAVPPGLGEGKSWKLHEVTVKLSDDRELTMLLQRGMPVAEPLHEYYWHMRGYLQSMLAEADKRGIVVNEYLLYKIDEAGVLRPFGYSLFDRTQGADADYLAWMACAFREYDDLRFSIPIPDDVPADAFGFTKTYRVEADGDQLCMQEEKR
jgi:hypothetical protein